MNRIEINGAKLREIRYELDLPARAVAELIDSSGQYLLDLEDGRRERTSTHYLHRLGMVYKPEVVAEAISNNLQKIVFLEQVAKRRKLQAL